MLVTFLTTLFLLLLVGYLLAYGLSSVLVYLTDECDETVVRAAVLRQELLINLAVSPSDSVLTPGQLVL